MDKKASAKADDSKGLFIVTIVAIVAIVSIVFMSHGFAPFQLSERIGAAIQFTGPSAAESAYIAQSTATGFGAAFSGSSTECSTSSTSQSQPSQPPSPTQPSQQSGAQYQSSSGSYSPSSSGSSSTSTGQYQSSTTSTTQESPATQQGKPTSAQDQQKLSDCEARKGAAFFMIMLKLNYHDSVKPKLQDIQAIDNEIWLISTQDATTGIPLPKGEDPFAGAECKKAIAGALKDLNPSTTTKGSGRNTVTTTTYGGIKYKEYSKYTEAEKNKLSDAILKLMLAMEKCKFKDGTNLEAWLEKRATDKTLDENYNKFSDEMEWNGFPSRKAASDEAAKRLSAAKTRAAAAKK